MNIGEPFAITAALLRRGRAVERLGQAFSVVAAGLLLVPAVFSAAALPGAGFVVLAAVLLLGGVGQYLAIRVGFDTALFEGLAGRDPAEPLDAFDRSMQSLGLMPSVKAGRPPEARCAGALRLFHLQLAVLYLQIGVMLLGAALASMDAGPTMIAPCTDTGDSR